MFNPSALLGAVLFAWFPEEENPHKPGPKFRPVLVVDSSPEDKRICVAYGTSRRVDACGLGEITFRQNEIQGLSHDTKFCLGNHKWIPLSAKYLSRSPSSNKLAVLGFIPPQRRDDLRLRILEVFNEQ